FSAGKINISVLSRLVDIMHAPKEESVKILLSPKRWKVYISFFSHLFRATHSSDFCALHRTLPGYFRLEFVFLESGTYLIRICSSPLTPFRIVHVMSLHRTD